MRTSILSYRSVLVGMLCAMPFTASAADVDPQCVGKINGYFWASKTTDTGTCTSNKATKCNKSFSNYCFSGKVLSIQIFSDCASVSCISTVTTPVATAPVVTTPAVKKFQWGVGGPTYISSQYAKAFKVLRERGLTTYRINVNLTADRPNALNDLATMHTEAKKQGIVLTPVIFVMYHWTGDGARKDNVDRTALYNDAYTRTFEVVERFRGEINDWELGNEVDLKMRHDNLAPLPPASWQAATFDTPRMGDWASILKGQADAIAAVNKKYGSKARGVLNVTGLNFGFLDYMQSKGVNFDVISYHYYERLGRDMSNFWNNNQIVRNYANPNNERTVSIFKALAKYGKPVIVNETNCAEIYDDKYENKAGGNLTQNCLQSFQSILTQIEEQKDATIEGVQAHTLVDIPNISPPAETRFGLMYDLDNPKLGLAILASHAGGLVSQKERDDLKAQGVTLK